MLNEKQKGKIISIIRNRLRSRLPYDWQLDSASYFGCEYVLNVIAEVWCCWILQQNECMFVLDLHPLGVATVTNNCVDKCSFIEVSKVFLPANISIKFIDVDILQPISFLETKKLNGNNL